MEKTKVAILGYGVEGKSALSYWKAKGADITICDANPDLEPPAGVKVKLGKDYLKYLDKFDLVVRSPGIRPHDIDTGKPVTSLTREFMAKCPAPIIGVTGTKGKGTTSTLITKMLEADGNKVWLGGNIGVPALDFLDKVKKTDWVVLELSSFQLMDATASPHIAVMLMIAPEHLNYHLSMSEYVEAKGNIFRYQSLSDVAVFKESDLEASRMVGLSKGEHIPYGHLDGAYVRDNSIWFRNHQITSVSEVGLLGRHNLENVCAAVAATWGIVGNPKPLAKAIKKFTGLPHRLEMVANAFGVRYFDDSIATTPETTIAAIRAFTEPKVVIIGGSDKGVEYRAMAEAIKAENVVKALVIGETGPKIIAELKRVGFKDYQTGFSSMEEVVMAAHEAAPDGGVVLLSPGCASFGMFKDYKDRGNQFKAAATGLVRR